MTAMSSKKPMAMCASAWARSEIGQTDGAAIPLAVTGPKVDAAVSLDDPQTTFFRDPSTGRAFTDIFALRTEIGASSNYAKFAYVSPDLFGAQLALSFTPRSKAVTVCPFCMKARMWPDARWISGKAR